MNFFDVIRRYVKKQVPTEENVQFNHLNATQRLAATLDVDRVHQILDAAERGDTDDLFTLYRDIIISDSHIQAELTKRKLAVLGDNLSIQPYDKDSELDQASADFCEAVINDVAGWNDALIHMLDSTVYPVAVIEKVYEGTQDPTRPFRLKKLVKVDHLLLDYRTGHLRIKDVDEKGAAKQTSHTADPNKYIIHRGHILSTPDFFGGPLRSLVFWFLFSAMDRDWWARYLDKYGAPFLVGKYDQNDDASRSILQRAFSYATKVGGLVVTRETEIDIKQASTSATGEAYEKFLTICQREKSKLILGQTLSAEAQSTGLGSGVSSSQEKVRDDIRQWDAARLASTLKDELFEPILKYNHFQGRAPVLVWGSQSAAEAEAMSSLLSSLAAGGLEVSDDGIEALSKQFGLPLQRLGARGIPSFNSDPFVTLRAESPSGAGRLAEEVDAANRQIACKGSAELAQAFRGSLAPMRQLVLNSTSAEDLEEKVVAYYADYRPEKVAELIEMALIAFAGNGVQAPRKS